MADKQIEDQLYRVVCKNGSHLNTKLNPDGSKSALQFKDGNNELSGPIDLIEVSEDELIRTEYIHASQKERTLCEQLVDEVVIPVIRDVMTQLLEYGSEKAEIWLEDKVVPMAKAKLKVGWDNIKLLAPASCCFCSMISLLAGMSLYFIMPTSTAVGDSNCSTMTRCCGR